MSAAQRSRVPRTVSLIPAQLLGSDAAVVARMQVMLSAWHSPALPHLPAPLLPLRHPYSNGRVAKPRAVGCESDFAPPLLLWGNLLWFFFPSVIMSVNVVVACYPWVWMTLLTRGNLSCLDSSAWPRNQEESYGEFCFGLTRVR